MRLKIIPHLGKVVILCSLPHLLGVKTWPHTRYNTIARSDPSIGINITRFENHVGFLAEKADICPCLQFQNKMVAPMNGVTIDGEGTEPFLHLEAARSIFNP